MYNFCIMPLFNYRTQQLHLPINVCVRSIIVRIRRRRTALVTVVLAMLTARLVLELTNRIRYGITGHRSPPVTMMISADATEQGRWRSGPVDLASVDLRIDYPIYVPSLPRFVNVNDRRSFMSDINNRVYFETPSHQLVGRVRIVSNAVIRRGHECSWKTSDEEFRRLSEGRRWTTSVNKTLCPLLVPDGHTFQHFVDAVLPKLVQLLTEAPRLAAAVDSFVIYQPRDMIIYELLERMGIARERLMLVRPESLQTLEVWSMVDTCVTPSLHPRLWRRASQLLQVCHDRSNCDVHQQTGRISCCLYNELRRNEPLDKSDEQGGSPGEKNGDVQYGRLDVTNGSVVILLSRRWTRNAGRRLLNENAVVEYLSGRFGRQRVARFGDGRTDLKTASRLFSRAAAVVGVHGGAFYNIILAPPGCVVVELMPLEARYSHVAAPPRRLAHTVVWRMADALRHTYWRLYAATSSPRSDVTLSIDKLHSALAGVT